MKGGARAVMSKKNLSTTILLMVEGILLISSILFCTVSVYRARIGIRRAIQQRMLDIANCASGSVNANSGGFGWRTFGGIDTCYAPGYTDGGFARIQPGMEIWQLKAESERLGVLLRADDPDSGRDE